jgi:hypothetical protein
MSGPIYTCSICERIVAVKPDGRGFPPDIAKRKLMNLCKKAGCKCDPKYKPGIHIAPRRGVESPTRS